MFQEGWYTQPFWASRYLDRRCVRGPDCLNPPPLQESSVNRSPLSGSTASAVGHVRLEATVCKIVPLDGSILKTAPVVKLPVVASRMANRLPLSSNASPASDGPSAVAVIKVLASATPPPGGIFKYRRSGNR